MPEPTSPVAPVADPPAPVADPPAPVADPPAPVADPPAPVADPPANETDADKVARLEKQLADARKEAGNQRVNAKAAAAKEAVDEVTQTIGKALGLVPGDTAPDPAALAQQVAEATAAKRQSDIELAVFRAADAVNGDASALLDSRTFLATVADVDPTDSVALAAAITEAIAGNPRLGKTAPGAPGMRPNPAQGAPQLPPVGLEGQIAQAEADGNLKRVMHLKSLQVIQTTPTP